MWAQAKKNWAVVLHPLLPAALVGQVLVCVSTAELFLLGFGILHQFCSAMPIALTPTCTPINVYVALLPGIMLPVQAHGLCFPFPRICGSLQGIQSLLCSLNHKGRAASAKGWKAVRTLQACATSSPLQSNGEPTEFP